MNEDKAYMPNKNTADGDEAFAKAQAEMKDAAFNKVNPHFKSKYADLSSVRAATLPALNKHGLTLSQAIQGCGEEYHLYTVIKFKGVIVIDSQYPLPNPRDEKPHIVGSALTYARRYSWAALCGIASDEDDDGNAAQDAPKKEEPAWKEASRRLNTAIGEAKSDEALAKLWKGAENDLKAIGAASERTLKALNDAFNEKAKSFELPEDGVEDIHPEEEIPE